MASLTHTSSVGSPSKIQDGPYQIELEDIESDETNNTTHTNTNTATVAQTHSTSPMKPENHYTTAAFTTGGEQGAADAEPPSRASTYAVRACVCGFAILLLWLTSLNLSKIFVLAFVHAPDTQQIVVGWNNLASATSLSRDQYTQCGTLQVNSCNRTLYYATDVMLTSIENNKTINTLTVQTAGLVAQYCSSLTVELTQAIKKWKDRHPFEDIQYNMSCSAQERADVQAWVDRPDLIQNQAYVLAGAYSKGVDSRSSRMLGYAQNFSDYNQNYIARKFNVSTGVLGRLGGLVPGFSDQFANITMGVLAPAGRLYNCMSMSSSAASLCPSGARAAWDERSQAVKDNYQTLKDKLGASTRLYASTTDALSRTINNVRNFYNTYISPVATSIAALNVPLGSFPSLNFGIPPSPSLAGTDLAWLDPDFTSLNVTSHFAEFGSSVAASALSSRNAAGAWWSNQSEVTTPLNGMFNDYNPPPLMGPMASEVTAQKDESADYRTQTAFALNQQPEAETKNQTVTLVKGFLAQQAKALSPTNFEFEPLSGNLLLAPLLDVIPNLYVLALAIDYIWRGYRSIRLIIKYWFQSAVGLPVIDVRDYENHAGATGPVKAVAVVTHPCTIVGVLLLLVALALASIVPPYTSIVSAYRDGCVDSSEGTVLSNNTFSIAYNYASSEGNKLLTEGYQQYDASRNEVCGRYLQKTTDDADAVVTSLTAANDAQSTNAEQTLTIYRCINFTTFGPVAGYNVTYYGARHPLVVVDEAIDRVNASDSTHPCMPAAMTGFTLLNAVFNCSSMPPCVASCGADRNAISFNSWRAACRTEYLVHSFIARFGITILVFISLNLSRMLFMAAVIRLGWRSLTPRGFEFVSNCTRIGETSRTINQQLVVALNKGIANYERFAIFLFGLAILVHVPYIVVLSTVNDTLEYSH